MFFCIHGAGLSALSFATLAKEVKHFGTIIAAVMVEIITVDVIYMQKKLGILFKFLQALLTPF